MEWQQSLLFACHNAGTAVSAGSPCGVPTSSSRLPSTPDPSPPPAADAAAASAASPRARARALALALSVLLLLSLSLRYAQWGFPDLKTYLAEIDSRPYLPKISVPLLCVQSADDPLYSGLPTADVKPHQVLPVGDLYDNPNIIYFETGM